MLFQTTDMNSLAVWLMNGTTRISVVSLPSMGAPWVVVGTSDLTGDGKADILWRNTATGEVLLWAMDGTTKLSQQSLGFASTDWHIVGTADMNRDGHPDIVWLHYPTGYSVVWFMGFPGGVPGKVGQDYLRDTNNSPLVVATTWKIMGLGDLDGDHDPDVVWESDSGYLAAWRMQLNGRLSVTVNPVPLPTGYRILGVADYNGDGHADILAEQVSAGSLNFLLSSTNPAYGVLTPPSPGLVSPIWQVVGAR